MSIFGMKSKPRNEMTYSKKSEREEAIERYLIQRGIKKEVAEKYAHEHSEGWKSDVDRDFNLK